MDDIEEKINEIINRIENSISEEVFHFEHSNISKIPNKINCFIEAINYKTLEFANVVKSLFDHDLVVPAIVMTRVLFESLSMIYQIRKTTEKLIKEGYSEEYDDKLMQLLFGTDYNETTKRVNVLTLLDKIDKEYKDVRKFYNDMSEFSHPNYDGILGSYSELDETNHKTYYKQILTKNEGVGRWAFCCFAFVISTINTEYLNIKDLLPQLAQSKSL